MSDEMRILDVDLDFFLNDVAHWPNSEERLDPEYFKPWEWAEADAFLKERCGLRAPLPGAGFEEHDEIFHVWRDLIESERLTVPFHVTHVDAHADLGLGDSGYVYLMTELLHQPLDIRSRPYTGRGGMGAGNFLAFAIANRWLSDLTYVYIPGGGSDLLSLHMEDYDPKGDRIQLKAIDPKDQGRLTSTFKPDPVRLEPAIPIREVRAETFTATKPFDFMFLARSPAFTPPTADDLFDAIRDTYIVPL